MSFWSDGFWAAEFWSFGFWGVDYAEEFDKKSALFVLVPKDNHAMLVLLQDKTLESL